jgi:hypothetical protein
MAPFTPRVITFAGHVPVAAPPDAAFPLFSPQGERGWVPDWSPELLHPPGVEWAEGQIFRTREATGDAVWIVTRLDAARRAVEYHRVEPGRWVARVRVACGPAPAGSSAAVEYEFVGLSESGNREIAAMTAADYDAKLARWSRWIAEHLHRRN